MTAVDQPERYRQPTVKRLGLDDGWWFFCPHFLNLGLPLVFVDTCLIPESKHLGLEPLGKRRPDSPLPSIDLRVRFLGDGVSLYSASPPASLIAAHWFRRPTLSQAFDGTSVGIIVGDSFALQLTWSALWTCSIGTVAVVKAPSHPD